MRLIVGWLMLHSSYRLLLHSLCRVLYWYKVRLNMRLYVILSLVSMLVGAAIAVKLLPTAKSVDRVVEHNNVVTVVKTITKADGSKESTETIIDNSVVSQNHTNVLPANTTKPNLFIYAGYDTNRIPYLGINKRLFGGLFVGAEARQNGTLGLNVGVEF